MELGDGNGFLLKIRHCRTARMKAKSPLFHFTGSAFHDLVKEFENIKRIEGDLFMLSATFKF